MGEGGEDRKGTSDEHVVVLGGAAGAWGDTSSAAPQLLDSGRCDYIFFEALAEVNFERGQAELVDQELGVITEVRRIARFVDTARQRRTSAGVSRQLEEKNLDAEQKRFENGLSTSFQVLQIQEDLTEARQREVNAVTNYRKAVVLYYQATGELLETTGVEILDAAE